MKTKPFILIGCFASCLILWTQNTMAYFESTVHGVRPAAMGEAFVSIADDSNAVLFNPAGFARIPKIEFNGMYADLYSNLNTQVFTGEDTYYGYHFLSLAIPVSTDIGSFGLAWTGFHTVFYKENVLSMSYGRRVLPEYNVDLGITIKAMQWRVEPNRYSTDADYFPYDERGKNGVTADLGAMATFIKRLHVGLSLGNIIPSDVGLTTTEYIPFNIRAGASYIFQIPAITYLDSVQPILEFNWQEDVYNVKAGVEGWLFNNIVALRTGVNMDCFTAGAGLSYQIRSMPVRLNVDYAFTMPFQIKDSMGSHRVGMIFQWNPTNKKLPKKVVQAMVTSETVPIPTPQPTPDIKKMINIAVAKAMEQRASIIASEKSTQVRLDAITQEKSRLSRARNFMVSQIPEIVIGFERKLLSDYANLQEMLTYLGYLENYLEDTIQINIIRQECASKSELIKAFKEGDIDIGLAPTEVFNMLKKDKHATARFRIQMDGKKHQKLCMWRLEDSYIRGVDDLYKKRLGYVNLNHLINIKNNFFAAIPEFHEGNYFQEKKQYNSPISALLALQMGEIDVLLGLEYLGSVAKRLESRVHNDIMVLAFSDGPKWMNTPVFSRTYLPEVKQEKHRLLMRALFEAHKNQEARKFMDYFNIEQFIPAQ